MLLRRFFKAARWLFIAPLLLCMGFSCTQSEIPLSSRDGGFVDGYLLGQWQEIDLISDESDALFWEPMSSLLEFDISEYGDIEVLTSTVGELTDTTTYLGHTTLLEGNKYLNLRTVNCEGCEEDELEKMKEDQCPYQIFRYWTFIPKQFEPLKKLQEEPLYIDGQEVVLVEPAREVEAELEGLRKSQQVTANSLRGRVLFFAIMDDDFVSAAISNDDVAGDPSCDTCFEGGACLQASEEELQDFVVENGDELFDPGLVVYLRIESSLLDYPDQKQR